MNGDVTCGDCGAPMKEYDLFDPATGETEGTEIVCPNEWRETHP